MPHLSKQKLTAEARQEIEANVTSLLSELNAKTRRLMVRELLTATERLMIAKRLTLLILLNHGVSIRKICKLLKISPSTVTRFQLHTTENRYKETLSWIDSSRRTNHALINLLSDLLSIPFKAQRKSLSQLLDEL